MKELIETGLNTAQLLGATYADIRIVNSERETLTVKNGIPQEVSFAESSGFGVRVLTQDAWGFAASFTLNKEEVEKAVKLAVEIAKSSALLKKEDVRLSPASPQKDTYKTKVKIDPFTVPLEEKLSYLLEADKLMRKNRQTKISRAAMDAFKNNQTFGSTEGAYIEQEIIHTGAGITAYAIKDGELQQRSYPNSHRGNFAAQGYEFVKSLKLDKNAEKIADEAERLLSAKPCSSAVTTVILDSSQVALQVHESIGHPSELDRVLGTEASLAGTSFMTLDKLGKFKVGSSIVSVVADPTIPQAVGSFGHDDEGVAAQRSDIIEEGYLVGYLSSRETAAYLGKESNGSMRADSWNMIPLIRMTNVNLKPGKKTLEELIGETKEGLLLKTNKSWSIDDRRLNFQFACEIGWEIRNGKLGKMVKNPNYTGTTTNFWNSCDGIANKNHWKMWGVINCGKGEPMQIAHVGHGASPARFRNIQVGVGSGQN